ncbi:MAG: hypothetical protein RLZZ373_2979 [Pseudomonadota bacterium]
MASTVTLLPDSSRLEDRFSGYVAECVIPLGSTKMLIWIDRRLAAAIPDAQADTAWTIEPFTSSDRGVTWQRPRGEQAVVAFGGPAGVSPKETSKLPGRTAKSYALAGVTANSRLRVVLKTLRGVRVSVSVDFTP